MKAVRKINADITWVGVDDRRLHLFENMFPLPHGVSYNSYVISDEKTALMDTADESVLPQFIENVLYALQGRSLDYMVVDHMEPDHCSGIARILEMFPACKMVATAKAFCFYDQMYNTKLPEERKILVKEGDSLSLGKHELTFVMAPMVHWPEVMMSYDKTDKVLFSADAFGTFGAVDGNIFSDELGWNETWWEEARRYYTNIVGKYGPQVQAVLKKAAGLDIALVAPLHGPTWKGKDIGAFIERYDAWSSYRPEVKGSVAIFYGSMYGDTKDLAEMLACALGERGVRGIRIYDVSETDKSYLISESFRSEYLVFAAPTYNNGLYPKMKEFIEDLSVLNFQNRKCSVLGNGTWAPQSEKLMRALLCGMKNMDVSENTLIVRSRISDAQLPELSDIADDIVSRLKA